MTDRIAQFASLLLAVIVVAGMSLSAQGYGATAEASDGACCCKAERTSDQSCEDADKGCCSTEQSQSEDDPCSCNCAGCNAFARTVNLFSIQTITPPLYESVAERLVPMPDCPPASAVLGVDIQPPIA